MKKAASVFVIIILALGVVSPAFCESGGAVKKLGRGLCNVLTCPMEILEQTKRVNNTDGPFAALTYGLVKGVVMTGTRALVGAYETVTFLIPLPKNYSPILTDPEFFFEEVVW